MHSQPRFLYKHSAPRSTQRGQSMVEIAVSMLVLIPLAVGVMLFGQYVHMQQTAQAAAREAAWAATADPALAGGSLPSTNTEQDRLRKHQFTLATTSLRSANVPTQFADPMLTTFAGHTLLKVGNLTLSSYTQTSAQGSYVDQAVGQIGGVLGQFGLGSSLPPNRQGLVSAQVTAQSEQLLGTDGSPLSFMGATASERFAFSSKTVLLADPWDAAGNGETLDGNAAGGAYANRTVRAVISPMAPSTWLGKFTGLVNGAVKILGSIPMLNSLMGLRRPDSQFEMGRTAPDVVPSDKLVPYRNVR